MIWQYFEIIYENFLYYYQNLFGINNINIDNDVMYRYLLTESTINYNTSEVDNLINETIREIKMDKEINILQERFDNLKNELHENSLLEEDDNSNNSNNNNNEGAVGCKIKTPIKKKKCKLFY
jgi:hypothetical protein